MFAKRFMCCPRGYIVAKNKYVTSYKYNGLLVRVCRFVGTFRAYRGQVGGILFVPTELMRA